MKVLKKSVFGKLNGDWSFNPYVYSDVLHFPHFFEIYVENPGNVNTRIKLLRQCQKQEQKRNKMFFFLMSNKKTTKCGSFWKTWIHKKFAFEGLLFERFEHILKFIFRS